MTDPTTSPAPRPDEDRRDWSEHKKDHEITLLRGRISALEAELQERSASPLPDEVAGLIKRLREYHTRTGAYAPEATCRHGIHPYDCESGCAPITFNAAAALQQIARENERLQKLVKCDACGKPFDENGGICEPCHTISVGGHIRPLGARIRELEAERDVIDALKALLEIREAEQEDAQAAAAMWKEAALGKASVNAIKAKTIEECAEIADKYWACEVASQIRALDQPPEAVKED